MKLLTSCFLGLILLSGCAGIDSTAYSAKNQNCVRQCTGVYSSCIGNAFGLIAQGGCSSGFSACANSCPDK